MHSPITLAFIILISPVILAQQSGELALVPVAVKTFDHSDYKLDGSPFLFETWTNGSVKDEDGNEFSDSMLKYDVFNKELLHKNTENDKVMQFRMDLLHSFELTEPTSEKRYLFQKLAFQKSGILGRDFYQVLYNGKVILIKSIKKEIIEPTYIGAFNTGSRNPRFRDKNELLLYDKGLELSRVTRSLRRLSELLNLPKKELRLFVKHNQLDLKIDLDLILIFENWGL